MAEMTTNYHGVFFDKGRGRWRAVYASKHLGYFNLDSVAAQAVDAAMRAAGEPEDRMNFPRQGKAEPKTPASDAVHVRLKRSHIKLNGQTQPRERIDNETVARYAEAMKEGAQFPPVVVFFDGRDYWLADGFHRFHAYRQAGVDEIPASVHDGSLQDARDYANSWLPNSRHGLHETQEDRWGRVRRVIEDHPDWSLRQVAEWTGVGKSTVERIKAAAHQKCPNGTVINAHEYVDRSGGNGATVERSITSELDGRHSTEEAAAQEHCPSGTPAEPTSNGEHEGRPWDRFNAGLDEVIADLESAARKLSKLGKSDGANFTNPYCYFFRWSGTVRPIRDVIAVLKEKRPAEPHDEPPGFIDVSTARQMAEARKRGR